VLYVQCIVVLSRTLSHLGTLSLSAYQMSKRGMLRLRYVYFRVDVISLATLQRTFLFVNHTRPFL
jgi:hypothetical protein